MGGVPGHTYVDGVGNVPDAEKATQKRETTEARGARRRNFSLCQQIKRGMMGQWRRARGLPLVIVLNSKVNGGAPD